MSWAERGRLSVDAGGRLTLHLPDAEGEPEEFLHLGVIDDQCWLDLRDLGVAGEWAGLLAEWHEGVAEGDRERRWALQDYWATR